ncbi:MAG: bifunctional oligoribonuclease/PAP phosphatase NrnA [Bacteroidales bacterium]|nr:bifunctional oligoribonuclease/PAP phosphatase NrnA [Bacteroidales bacterium]MBN2748104.1 bifunctional oligoribonuclease/PAP phosphatase NrnA [Bacteroidales bacterium]
MLKTLSAENIEKLRNLLQTAEQVVITTHHNPDGDALGSALGLYHILKNKGYSPVVVTTNSFPDSLGWIPGTDSIVKFSHQAELVNELVLKADIVFCLDFNAYNRTEKMADVLASSTGTKVLIDHHPFPESAFGIQFSETEVSSTAELVFEVFTSLWDEGAVDTSAAICLYTGIMTDTGSFSYACNRGRTFEVAGKLVGKGVKVDNVQSAVYNNFSVERMRLYGFSLAEKMKVFPEYNAAYIALTKDELTRFSHKMGDTEGFVNLPLSVKGVVFSALFIENEGLIKVSLRSRGSFPVNKVSKEFFNGGGHTNAAGGKSFATLAETEALFTNIIEKYKNELLSE